MTTEGFEFSPAQEAEWTAYKEAHTTGDPRTGQRFGPKTAEMMGLDPFHYYESGELADFYARLRHYSAEYFNQPSLKVDPRWQYWVRGAQLGLTPEEYHGFRRTETTAGAYTETEYGQLSQRLGLKGAELGKAVKYLYGQSDIAPKGLRSVAPGLIPTMGGGRPVKPTAKQWFQKEYPSIIRGGAAMRAKASTRDTWGDILKGKYAPKIKTIGF